MVASRMGDKDGMARPGGGVFSLPIKRRPARLQAAAREPVRAPLWLSKKPCTVAGLAGILRAWITRRAPA